ncbi:MAG: hypothetical protein ABIS50_01790 [Luteolibacter sp.]|uniref:hypothetical protein n=1 Tax=Luteolibacter sp. TaxID=1962973 RepID=UPI00326629B4
MDPIYPWLDPIEVRRLADRLMRPNREPEMSVEDAGFDNGFVGYATEQLAVQATAPALPPPPREVASLPPPEMQVPPPLPENQTTARGPFLERIQRFRDWMRHHFSATGIFILDREGAVIFDESSHGRLHFLARSLALASRRPGASAGNVHVKIGAGATLEVIPVETAYGCLVLGAVVPEALAPPSVVAVMEALNQVASPPAENA